MAEICLTFGLVFPCWMPVVEMKVNTPLLQSAGTDREYQSFVAPKKERTLPRKAKAPAKPSKPRKAKAKAAVKTPVTELRTSRFKPVLWRALKWVLWGLLALVALFVVVSVSYRFSGVHPVSTLMIGQRLQGKTVQRAWVNFDDISPNVWQSVISSEDGQFCAHGGVDWNQINIVIDDALEGEGMRGASTLSMQSVKNLFLWPSRSYLRKVMEIPMAMWIDFIWGKKRTMEIYLNIAEWGPGIFGIETAAQHYFKRSAARLSRRQAALLTVALPNPHIRNPRKPGRGLLRLARLVEKRARASGAYVKCLR